MPINKGSDNMLLEVALETTDIGGTSATSKSVDMSACDDVMFVVEAGTYTDATLVCQLMQDTQADMASGDVKAVESAKTHTDVADGQRYCHQCKAEDLDTENLGAISGAHFRYVALKVSEAADIGVNEVTVASNAFNLRKRYANRAAYDAVDASS